MERNSELGAKKFLGPEQEVHALLLKVFPARREKVREISASLMLLI
jgi:hypothetical protein